MFFITLVFWLGCILVDITGMLQHSFFILFGDLEIFLIWLFHHINVPNKGGEKYTVIYPFHTTGLVIYSRKHIKTLYFLMFSRV